MVSFLKSLQSIFTGLFAELPEGVKILTEFVWKCRWFLFFGWVTFFVYNLVMKVLPYLMWTFVIKSIFGSAFSFLSLL